MFTGITWKDYLITATLLLISYYAAVLCWMYLNRLRVYLKPNLQNANQKFENNTLGYSKTEKLPIEVDKVVVLLKEKIAHCFHQGHNREQLLNCIAKILSDHPSLRNTAFREHIIQSIINECNKYGPVGLRNAELMGLWNAKTLHAVP